MEWKNFSEEKPTKDGWYLCTVKGAKVLDSSPRYVMELYWFSNKNEFIDNIRRHVFMAYNVYSITGERMYDNCNRTDDVVAWAELPAPCMED